MKSGGEREIQLSSFREKKVVVLQFGSSTEVLPWASNFIKAVESLVCGHL